MFSTTKVTKLPHDKRFPHTPRPARFSPRHPQQLPTARTKARTSTTSCKAHVMTNQIAPEQNPTPHAMRPLDAPHPSTTKTPFAAS